LLAWAGRHYARLLGRGIRSTKPALLLLGVLALTGVVVVPQLWQSPLPTFKETDFLVDLDGAPGTSLPEMDRIATRVITELKTIPGVRDVAGHVGRALTSDSVVSPNSGRLWVSINPHANYDNTVSAIRHTVRGYPGIDTDVMTYSEARIADAQGGNDEAVVVRLFGQDLGILRQKAGEITAALGDVKGLTGLHPDLPQEEPTVQVEVNLEAAKASGIKPGDVRRAAATLLSGVQVGSLFQEQKVFDVVVWGAPSTRENVTSIKNLLIDTPGGGHARLGDVASVDVKPSPNVIERDAVSRRVDVTAGVKGRSQNAVLADVRQRLEKVQFPLEYHYELVGNYSQRQAVTHRVTLVAIAAALGIFLLLQALFGSWRLAALAFLTLPFALVGAAVAVLLDGGAIELGALVGVLTVFGIAARHTIRLIRRFQELERQTPEADAADLVVRGARDELAPTLLTTLCTGLLFLPFVLRGDLPGNELVNPMGAVVIGGLATAAVVNLFLVPALYMRFHRTGDDGEELDLRDLWAVDTPALNGDTNGANGEVTSESVLAAQP
jgi:Cu/Ag efflux pump CusA